MTRRLNILEASVSKDRIFIMTYSVVLHGETVYYFCDFVLIQISQCIMASRGHLKTEKVSQKELHQITGQKGSVYVGSSVDIQQRTGQHQREGYSGTVYYASTDNMMRAEDKLLQQNPGRHNIQQQSNAEQGKGYVYGIKGRKHN